MLRSSSNKSDEKSEVAGFAQGHASLGGRAGMRTESGTPTSLDDRIFLGKPTNSALLGSSRHVRAV